jgi:hypothetical protein
MSRTVPQVEILKLKRLLLCTGEPIKMHLQMIDRPPGLKESISYTVSLLLAHTLEDVSLDSSMWVVEEKIDFIDTMANFTVKMKQLSSHKGQPFIIRIMHNKIVTLMSPPFCVV